MNQRMLEEELSSFERRPDWELKHVVKALDSFSFLNGEREEARLAAVRVILKKRRARRRAVKPS